MIEVYKITHDMYDRSPSKHSDVAPTSSGRHVHRQRVVIQFLTSDRRPADVSDWSRRRIDDLCDRQRATSSLREAVRCGVAGGSCLFAATRTVEAAPARLTIARCTCTASRQILDWRNWTPSDQQLQHLLASTGFAGLCFAGLLWSTWVLAGCSKVGYISTETGGRNDNECYIHTRRTDDTIIQHKVIRDVNLI